MRLLVVLCLWFPAVAFAGDARFVSADEVAILSTADRNVAWFAAQAPHWERQVVRVLGDGVSDAVLHPNGRSVVLDAGESSHLFTFTPTQPKSGYFYVERDRIEAIPLPAVRAAIRPAEEGRWLVLSGNGLFAREDDDRWKLIAAEAGYSPRVFMEPMGTLVELRLQEKTAFFSVRELGASGDWLTTDLSPPVPAGATTQPLSFGAPAKDGDRLVWFASAGNANAVPAAKDATCSRLIIRVRHTGGGEWSLDGGSVDAPCSDEAPTAVDGDRFIYQGGLYDVRDGTWQKVEQIFGRGKVVVDVWPDPLELLVTETCGYCGGFGTPERTYPLTLMTRRDGVWTSTDLGPYAWSPRISEWCSQASPSTFAPLWIAFIARCVRRRRCRKPTAFA